MDKEPEKRQAGLEPWRWIAQAGAGIVALAAVGLAIWEGLENRRHNRLSVMPNVDAVRDFDMRAQTFSFGFLSSGLGPAVVKDLQLYLDDTMIYDRNSEHEYAWSDVYPVLRGKNLDVWDAYYQEGQFLMPGARYDLLRAEPREGEFELIDNFREMADRISIVICYCSVYGDQCDSEVLGVRDMDRGVCP